MSAYIVSKSHIDALLRVGLEGPADNGPRYPGHSAWYTLQWSRTDPALDPHADRVELTHETADAVGAMLTAENVRSVQHRYPSDSFDDLPGPVANSWAADAMLGTYTYPLHGTGPIRIGAAPRHLLTVEALKAIDGYEYQACEHPEWWASEARQFCDALRGMVIGRLAGYDDADTWEVSDRQTASA